MIFLLILSSHVTTEFLGTHRLKGVLEWRSYKVLYAPPLAFAVAAAFSLGAAHCQSKVRFTSLKKVLLWSCR